MTDENHRPDKPRGSYPKGRRRREEIVTAATQIFARSGYTGAAVSTVAETVGLTVPGLLHHFPRKVDLLIAVLDRRDEESDAIQSSETLDWRAVLRNLVTIARHNETIPGVVRAFAILQSESLGEDHPATAWFEARTARLQGWLAARIRRGIQSGEIDPATDPEEIASEVIAMMDGLQLQWLQDTETRTMSGTLERYVERLIAGIEAR